MLAPTTKIISSLSIKASQITVPCHNSQTIMTAPTSFAITSSFLGSHRVPTPLTLKRPVMAAPTSLKIGVATHSAGRDFFSAEPRRRAGGCAKDGGLHDGELDSSLLLLLPGSLVRQPPPSLDPRAATVGSARPSSNGRAPSTPPRWTAPPRFLCRT